MNEELFPSYDPSIASEFGYEDISSTFTFLNPNDTESIIHLLIRFGMHMLVCFLIIHFCYYRKSRNTDFYKSLFFFGAGMFLLLFLLESIKLQIGLTLGLFAIFGVIRYRTETVPINEMTYLFMIIAISVINGLSLDISYLELCIANILIVLVIFIFDYQKFFKPVCSKIVLYEKIELIKPQNRELMIADLKERTGLDIYDIEIGHIDFLKDVAIVKIYYKSTGRDNSLLNYTTKIKNF